MKNLFGLSFVFLFVFIAADYTCKGLESKKDSLIFTANDTTALKNSKISDSSNTVKTEPQIVDTFKTDTIIKKNGFAVICRVVSKNLYEVHYIKQGQKLVRKISTADLKEIRYNTGKIDLIDNNPEKKEKNWVTTPSEKDWAKVKVCYDAGDVAGLVEKGPIENEYIAKKLNTENDVMERTTLIVLQKKASKMNACAILIVSKDFVREYGELPSLKMKAIAYGKE